MFLRIEFLDSPNLLPYGLIEMGVKEEEGPFFVSSTGSFQESKPKQGLLRLAWNTKSPEEQVTFILSHILPKLKTFPSIKEASRFLGLTEKTTLIFKPSDLENAIPLDCYLISSLDLDRNGFLFVTNKGGSGFLLKNPEKRLALCFSKNISES